MTTTTASKKNYPFCKEKQALILPNPNDDDAMQRAQHNEDKTLNTHVYSPLQCQDQAALHFLPTIILYSLNRLYHNTILPTIEFPIVILYSSRQTSTHTPC